MQLNIGGKYNWQGQSERLVYLGSRRYAGDGRTWHQFALTKEPTVVWCEVLESDLEHFEDTTK